MLVMVDDVDYAHTAVAEENRRRKVAVVASWCWQRGITAGDLDRCSPVQLVVIAGQARVGAPGAGSTTWHGVKVALERMAAWAAAHPGDPRAGQPYRGLGAQWVPPRAPQGPEIDSPDAVRRRVLALMEAVDACPHNMHEVVRGKG